MGQQQIAIDQQQIAIDLQAMADNKEFNNVGALAGTCARLGASYTVMAWLDRYCLKHGLYKFND